jgi:hypothetical protein
MTFRLGYLLLIVLLCSCSKRESDLLGVWSTGTEKITFLQDGTALIEGPQAPLALNWRWLDQDRFMLTGTGMGQVTFVGCMAAGMIKFRVRSPINGQENIATYYRTASDGTLITTRTSVTGPFGGSRATDCTP